jgi:hypothetical protein
MLWQNNFFLTNPMDILKSPKLPQYFTRAFNVLKCTESFNLCIIHGKKGFNSEITVSNSVLRLLMKGFFETLNSGQKLQVTLITRFPKARTIVKKWRLQISRYLSPCGLFLLSPYLAFGLFQMSAYPALRLVSKMPKYLALRFTPSLVSSVQYPCT